MAATLRPTIAGCTEEIPARSLQRDSQERKDYGLMNVFGGNENTSLPVGSKPYGLSRDLPFQGMHANDLAGTEAADALADAICIPANRNMNRTRFFAVFITPDCIMIEDAASSASILLFKPRLQGCHCGNEAR